MDDIVRQQQRESQIKVPGAAKATMWLNRKAMDDGELQVPKEPE